MEIRGKVTVSKRVVLQLAAYVAAHCDGVKCLVDKNSGDIISRIITGKGEKGVYLNNTKQGLELEVCVICRYGTDAETLCEDIRKRIISELEGTGFKLSKVKVNISGMEK